MQALYATYKNAFGRDGKDVREVLTSLARGAREGVGSLSIESQRGF
jgi:hypothetical protein